MIDFKSQRGRRIAFIAIALTLVAIALARVLHTYEIFVQVYDEPAHIGVGMEWLDNGTYRYETQHPPMRSVFAIGPYLLGARYGEETSFWNAGNRILYETGEYKARLTAARLAALPFFLLMLYVTWAWARDVFGRGVALASLMFASSLPLLLAHAGVATLDMLVTATFMLATYRFVKWLEDPTPSRSLWLGVAVAAAVLSKFSAILFMAVTFALITAASLVSPANGTTRLAHILRLARVRNVAIIGVSIIAVFWAGYRFSLEPIAKPADRPHHSLDRLFADSPTLRGLAYRVLEMPIPAAPLLQGIGFAKHHLRSGHLAYFRGEIGNQGWKSFFPVAILIKTPIPVTILALLGLIATLRAAWSRRDWRLSTPALAGAAVIAACVPLSINIGVRHVLPVFPIVAILAGFGWCQLWNMNGRRHLARGAALALLAWHLFASARVHPDYLAYFNECCAQHPERYLVDSDLDWGQDLGRLADHLAERRIGSIALAYFGTADITRHHLPPTRPLLPYREERGWIAISEYYLAYGSKKPPYDQYRWLTRHEPVARIGKSIRLYHIPDDRDAAATPAAK